MVGCMQKPQSQFLHHRMIIDAILFTYVSTETHTYTNACHFLTLNKKENEKYLQK